MQMDEGLRKQVIRNTILVVLLTISYVNLIGWYAIFVTLFLSVLYIYDYRKESERLRLGLPKIDERSLKVAGQAAMTTWRVTFFFLFGLAFVFAAAGSLLIAQVLIGCAGFTLVTAMVSSYYYDRKGD